MISCQVEGLLSVLDSVAWKKSNNDPITGAMADFEIADGAYDAGTKSQTTTLTVKNGINTADTTYKCAVTRGGQTRDTVVNLAIFSKYIFTKGLQINAFQMRQASISNIFTFSDFKSSRVFHRDTNILILHRGVPKVILQRFGLIARPSFIRFAKFLRECFGKVYTPDSEIGVHFFE